MDADASILTLLIVFGVGGLGVLAVLYGTLAKNNWGVNLDPVSCPRCHTPLPRLREPRSLRQAMWGGWTCPACGAGVDKWGREIVPIAPPTIVKSVAEMERLFKRKFILGAAAAFCLITLTDLTGVTGERIPTSWGEALYRICDTAVSTSLLAVVIYFVMKAFRNRFLSGAKRHGPSR